MGIESVLLGQSDVASDDQRGVGFAQLEQLVDLSGVETVPIEGRKYSVHRVVEHGGRNFKVRAFRSAGAAQRQLNLIRRIPYLFPRCYGRIGRCLIWDYEPSVSVPTGRNMMVDIGAFLAEMSHVDTAPLSEEAFAGWCEDIRRAGIFFLQRAFL